MLDYISEIISFIFGFLGGSLTVGIAIHVKYNRMTNRQNGNNVASTGAVAAGNVNGDIYIANGSTASVTPMDLSTEAKRILTNLFPDTCIYLDREAQTMFAYSETRNKRQMDMTNYSSTVEALNELESFRYLTCYQDFQTKTIYHLTAQGRTAIHAIRGDK